MLGTRTIGRSLVFGLGYVVGTRAGRERLSAVGTLVNHELIATPKGARKKRDSAAYAAALEERAELSRLATLRPQPDVPFAGGEFVPTTVEPLLGLLLKENTKYLPFTALDSTVGASISPNTLSSGDAILVSTGYLLVTLAVTWLLFVKRDAA